MLNDLEKYFKENEPRGRMIDKPNFFLKIYDTILSRYRDTDIFLVEIGVGSGGSLQMWKNYLGSKATIYGIDKLDRKYFEEEQVKFIQADQGDNDFSKKIIEAVPKIDVLIDDGSHICSHQIATFKGLFKYISSGGLYICEDTHTSYREKYEGGYKRPGTFIEYCKDILDGMHYSEDENIPRLNEINQIGSITFYRSMAIIKKTEAGGSNV